jgi:hypothetical protein
MTYVNSSWPRRSLPWLLDANSKGVVEERPGDKTTWHDRPIVGEARIGTPAYVLLGLALRGRIPAVAPGL